MLDSVKIQIAFCSKIIATDFTGVRFLSSMKNKVIFQRYSPCKRFPTDLTTVRFLSSMDSFMSLKDISVSAYFVTVATGVLFGSLEPHGNRFCKKNKNYRKVHKFLTLENVAVILLKFKQKAQTLEYVIKRMHKE